MTEENEPAGRARTPQHDAAAGRALLYTVAQVLPLAALLVGFKFHKLSILNGNPEAIALARLLAQDALVLLALVTAFTAALAMARGAVRVGLGALLLAVVMALGVGAVLEHGFFVATGSYLDWPLLSYGLANAVALRAVFLNAVPPFVVGALLAVVALVVAPLVASRIPAVRRQAARLRAAPRVVGAGLGVALTIAAGLALHPPAVADHLLPLRASVVVELTGGLVGLVSEELPVPDPARRAPLVVSARADARPLNVVLVIFESVRASATTPYADAMPTTPVLADLARRGALVEHAYTSVPHTTKALVPIHCGVWPRIEMGTTEAEPGALPHACLPGLLRERGYATALYQSVDEDYEQGRELAERFGFETYRGAESLPTDGFDRTSYLGYEDDVLIAPALDWVDQQERPFLLTLLTITPHHDYRVPKGFEREKLSDNEDLDGYLNGVRYLDRFLGRLMAGFEERGLAERTLFVIVADHGEGFGEHGRYQHDNVVYEEGLHVPLVLYGAGIEPGTRIRGLRQNIDVVPTVLDVLGLDVASGWLPGRSLRDPEGHDTLYFGCYYASQCLAARRGDIKLVHHFGRRPDEVFDLASDPGETQSRPALAPAGLLDQMLAWKLRTNAVYGARR